MTWTCPKCEKVFEPDPRLKKDPYAHFCVKDEPLDFSQVTQAKRCMKLYVAGPMSGLPEYNYPAFHKAAADQCDHWALEEAVA